jgi:hypothetical protein
MGGGAMITIDITGSADEDETMVLGTIVPTLDNQSIQNHFIYLIPQLELQLVEVK